MMKAILVVTILVTITGGSIGLPVAPQAVDWPAVVTKVNEIRTLVRDGTNLAKLIANNDNPTVGVNIGRKLDAALAKALVVLENANNAIDAENLTEAQAKADFQELEGILNDAVEGLQEDLAQLSPDGAARLREIFYEERRQVGQKAQELYDLLRQ